LFKPCGGGGGGGGGDRELLRFARNDEEMGRPI
jgi:hypothetical protein